MDRNTDSKWNTDMVETPIADALLRISKMTRHSFHALPLLHGGSLKDSMLGDRYDALYGRHYPRIELTVTGKHFDSFLFSDSVIRKAEDLAADAFGADGTLFITSGTTTSNHIAVDALSEPGGRVLLDKSCHLSMHMALASTRAAIDLLPTVYQCEQTQFSYWSVEDLLERLLKAQHENAPHQLVVLNGHSYEGLLYDIPAVLEYLLENGVSTRRFLIDEAWSSATYFTEATQRYCAMNVSKLLDRYPDLVVVSTQSAHKSLSCLGQASMIHFHGDRQWLGRLSASRIRKHTTSPSYPILASLDLARAQMKAEGARLTRESMRAVSSFREALATDPSLAVYSIDRGPLPQNPFPYAAHHPAKLSLNVSGTGLTPAEVCERLFSLHGLYISRMTQSSVWLHFHIGIGTLAVERLLDGLREIAQRRGAAATQFSVSPDSISQSLIVPYPPGVPIIVPGEKVEAGMCQKIESEKRAGTPVISV